MSAALAFFDSLPMYPTSLKFMEPFQSGVKIGYQRNDGTRVAAYVREEDWLNGVDDQARLAFKLYLEKQMKL